MNTQRKMPYHVSATAGSFKHRRTNTTYQDTISCYCGAFPTRPPKKKLATFASLTVLFAQVCYPKRKGGFAMPEKIAFGVDFCKVAIARLLAALIVVTSTLVIPALL